MCTDERFRTYRDWETNWNAVTETYTLVPKTETGSNQGIFTSKNQPSQQTSRDGIRLNRYRVIALNAAGTASVTSKGAKLIVTG